MNSSPFSPVTCTLNCAIGTIRKADDVKGFPDKFDMAMKTCDETQVFLPFCEDPIQPKLNIHSVHSVLINHVWLLIISYST